MTMCRGVHSEVSQAQTIVTGNTDFVTTGTVMMARIAGGASLVRFYLFLKMLAKIWASIVEIAEATDNQSNEASQRKSTTTKFPLCSIAKELATQHLDRFLSLDPRWRRRECNTETGALTTKIFLALISASE